jgi:hypothetical protein
MSERIKAEELNKGDIIIRAAHRAPHGCSMLGRDVCNHPSCDVPEERYEVMGKRRAPKGLRVELRHPHGWGCKLVADKDGMLPEGWRKA